MSFIQFVRMTSSLGWIIKLKEILHTHIRLNNYDAITYVEESQAVMSEINRIGRPEIKATSSLRHRGMYDVSRRCACGAASSVSPLRWRANSSGPADDDIKQRMNDNIRILYNLLSCELYDVYTCVPLLRTCIAYMYAIPVPIHCNMYRVHECHTCIRYRYTRVNIALILTVPLHTSMEPITWWS